MSLLSSFSQDFNSKINIYRRKEKRNELGESIGEWEDIYSQIPCLVMTNLIDSKMLYKGGSEQKNTGGVEYISISHKVRLELGPDIKKEDKIIDKKGKEYEVVYAEGAPGFGGKDDHLLILCNKIE